MLMRQSSTPIRGGMSVERSAASSAACMHGNDISNLGQGSNDTASTWAAQRPSWKGLLTCYSMLLQASNDIPHLQHEAQW